MTRTRAFLAAALACLAPLSCDSPAGPNLLETEQTGAPAARSTAPSSGDEARGVVLESETFVRESGKPSVVHREFSTLGFDPPYLLHLANGDDYGMHRVSSARVRIDGVEVLGPENFNEEVAGWDFEVALGEDATLDVELEGAPGDLFTIHIDGALQRAADVGSDGGTAVLEGGAVVLEIPSGAVGGETTFTAEPVDDVAEPPPPGSEPLPGTRIELGPDGATFDEPVDVKVVFDPTFVPPQVPVENLRLFTLENGVWKLLPGSVDPVTNTVTGATLHFSEFAVLSRAEFCPGAGGGAFDTLEDALFATIDGGTVEVCDGTHPVEGVVVDRPVTIQALEGAGPVLQTSTELQGLLVDGVAAGTVLIDGLTFDLDTPTVDPAVATSYAIRTAGTWDQLVVQNSTFDIDTAARGGIAAATSSVAGAALFADNLVFQGGHRAISMIGVHMELTDSDVSGNSEISVSLSGPTTGAPLGSATALLQGNSFADCGTRCVRPFNGAEVDVVGNDFGQCGSLRCVSVGSGAHVDVTGNTFAAPVLTGDSGPDQNEIVLITQAASGTITGNTFEGCGYWTCLSLGGGSTVSVSGGNQFTHVAGQTEWTWASVMDIDGGANVTVTGNTVHSCGPVCYKVLDGSTASITGETVSVPAGHGTIFVLIGAFDDPAAPSNTLTFADNVVTGAGEGSAASFSKSDATLTGNSFSGMAGGFEVHGVATLGGRDNVIGITGGVAAIGIFDDGHADFRFNDFTGQTTDIGSAGDGTSILTCNWWGDMGGPGAVSGTDPAVFAPWSLQPVANTGANNCATEVRVAASDDGSGLPFVPTLGEAVAVIAPAGTVHVSDGSHPAEDIAVDRPMTIQAEPGASPVLLTNTGQHGLVVDGFAAGTVLIDGLTFDFNTPTVDASVATTYAIRGIGTWDRLEVRRSTFLIDPAARGAIATNGSTVPSTLVVDSVVVDGGVFGLALNAVAAEVTNSDISGTSAFGVSLGAGTTALVQDNSFADCGSRCVRPLGGSDVDVIGNDFGECGALRCISVGGSSQVDVIDNTFAAPVLSGDPGVDQDQIILFTQTSTGTIQGNTFAGCGYWSCVALEGGSTVTVSGNEFTHVAGQSEWTYASLLDIRLGADVAVTGNTVHSCGPVCYKVLDGATADITEETVSLPAGHGTMYVLLGAFDDAAAPANTITFQDNVVTGAGEGLAIALSQSAATVTGNTFSGVEGGFEVNGGASLTGRDNLVGITGGVAAMGVFEDGHADFRFNDFTGQATDIGSPGDGTSVLTCNWWGSGSGPSTTSGAPAPMYTPWATAAVAGTGAVDCSGGL